MDHYEMVMAVADNLRDLFKQYALAEYKQDAERALLELRNEIEHTVIWLKDHEDLTVFYEIPSVKMKVEV